MPGAKTIAGINVELGMSTASIIKDAERAEKTMNSFSTKVNKALYKMDRSWKNLNNRVSRATKNFFSLKSIAFQLAGGAGLGLLVNKALEVGDNIAKTADSIGIATDALQEYRFAGDLAGVSSEKLDKAFQKYSKAVGEAKAETGALVTLLRKTDEQLLRQIQTSANTTVALEHIFNAMASYEDHTERAALANAAFGRSGVDMLVMLKNGTEELHKARQAAHKYGVVIDERLLRDSEKAKDAISILTKVLKTRMTVAVLESAEDITRLATSLTEAIGPIAKFTADIMESVSAVAKWSYELGQAAANIDSRILGKTVDVLEDYKDSLRAAQVEHDNLTVRVSRGQMADMEASQQRLAELEAYISMMQRTIEKHEELNSVAEVKPDVNGRSTSSGGDQKSASDAAYDEQMAKLTAEIEKQRKEEERLATLRSKGESVIDKIKTEAEKYKEEMADLDAMLKEGIITQDQYNKAVEKGKEQYSKATKEMDVMDRAFGEIENALSGNLDSWQDWGGAVIRIISDVIQQQLKVGGSSSSSGGLFSSLGSIGSLFGGTSSGGGLLSGIGSFFGGLFHAGGKVTGGGSSRQVDPSVFIGAKRYHNGGLVGDEVPAILKKGERVLTEDQQRTYGKGDTNNITYNIDARGASAEAVERLEQAFTIFNSGFDTRAVTAVRVERQRNPNLFN